MLSDKEQSIFESYCIIDNAIMYARRMLATKEVTCSKSTFGTAAKTAEMKLSHNWLCPLSWIQRYLTLRKTRSLYSFIYYEGGYDTLIIVE